MDKNAEVFVTNFNKNFTGVSSTASNVLLEQVKKYKLNLVGYDLPGGPKPISCLKAYALAKKKPNNRPFSIWHVRRNNEMIAALIARDILRLPIKIVFTSAAQRRHSIFPRWLISKMDTVIATTKRAADFIPNVGAIIPHGVNTDLFRPSKNIEKDWETMGFPGSMGVATIGRIREEKGTDLFIDTMLEILPKKKGLTALVIGKAMIEDRYFLDALKSKVLKAGLKDRIIFTGEISPEKLPRIIRSLSLLISLPRYEGFGMTPLEGLASGVPFVASETGYFKEFSDEGRCGKVVPIGDTKSAIKEIDTLLADKTYRLSIGAADRSFVESSYSIAKEAKLINSVYDNLWS